MRKTLLILTTILCVCVASAQDKELTHVSYISPNKDTLMLPNDVVGALINETWFDTLESERPKIVFASPLTIAMLNRRLYEINRD
jgi:hypothetical protein